MTDPQALLALAAKIEAADGPSRELDAEITVARWPDLTAHYSPDPERGVGRWINQRGERMYAGSFTESVDDALMLVPAGERRKVLEAAIRWCMERQGFESDDFDWISYLARSICAAAIKAMAASTTSEGDE